MTSPDLRCVLATTDLSANAAPAMRRAAALARHHGAELHVLHVIDDADADLTSDEVREVLQRQTRFLDPPARLHIRHGTPFTEIAEHADELDAALIVTGARGWHSLRERVLGTTAERVVRHGHRPVLVVRDESEEVGEPERVLVGVDLSDASAGALRFARRAFPDAHLTALHVSVLVGERKLLLVGADEEALARLRAAAVPEGEAALDAWLAEHGLPADERQVVAGWPTNVLPTLAEAHDLVVVAPKGGLGVRSVLLGSVAQRVLREAPGDVLVVHPAAAEAEEAAEGGHRGEADGLPR